MTERQTDRQSVGQADRQTEPCRAQCMPRQGLGQRGETAAASFLQRRGLHILARNYRWREGEIDIIAAEDPFRICGQAGTIRFIEVKTRSSDRYGTPGAAVTFGKQARIRRTALKWLQEQEHPVFGNLCFDVIEVCVLDGRARLRWLKDCFF